MNIYQKSEIPEHLQCYFEPAELGLEETPELYVNKMVEIFREIRRVLKDDGTLWLNLGDSYNNVGGGNAFNAPVNTISGSQKQAHKGVQSKKKWVKSCKPKDLIGIPWRIAFALQADGWYLRSDIIWAKPNPMPESVTDRPTKSHEYVFLLSKNQRYYFDQDAVREPHQSDALERTLNPRHKYGKALDSFGNGETAHNGMGAHPNGRNLRSVWHIPTQSFPEAHFATFPEKLIEPCIKAGCPVGGVVLDPFMGSGTTAVVAHKLDRQWIGIELNQEYIDMATRRIEKATQQLRMEL